MGTMNFGLNLQQGPSSGEHLIVQPQKQLLDTKQTHPYFHSFPQNPCMQASNSYASFMFIIL